MPLTVSDIIKMHDAGFTDEDIERINSPAVPAALAEPPAPIVTEVPEQPTETPQNILSEMLK